VNNCWFITSIEHYVRIYLLLSMCHGMQIREL
jgi:hypothetical protein